MGKDFENVANYLTLGTYGLGREIISGAKDMLYGNARKANELQEQAQAQAKKAAQDQATASEQAMNAANKKKPDISAILNAAQNTSKTGGNSTMLTGPQGAAPSALGSSSLLGS